MTGLKRHPAFLWEILRGLYKSIYSSRTMTIAYGYFDKKKGETIIMKEHQRHDGFQDDLKGGPPFGLNQ